MEYKRKRLSGSANCKLKADKEAQKEAFMEKMPTLTNFFIKSETLSMGITLHDNDAQQSIKNEKDIQLQQQEEQEQSKLSQLEDQGKEYLVEDDANSISSVDYEPSSILSIDYDDPAL
ncbi:hypothetical protein CHUAL_009674 [Chamberlinius hualienensis]